MADRPPQFGRVPFALVDAGAIASMTPAAVRVYLCLCGHVNGHDWTANPKEDRIARLTGLGERAVRQALSVLKRLGAVAVEPGRGRGHASRYTVETKGEWPCLFSDREKGHAHDRKGARARPKVRVYKDEQSGTEGPASPSASEGPKERKADAQKGAAGRLVALWAEGSTARGLPFRDRDKVAGTLARMLAAGWQEAVLAEAVRLWWGKERPGGYAVGFFEARANGGDRELTRRPAAGNDAAALKRSASAAAVIAEATGMEA